MHQPPAPSFPNHPAIVRGWGAIAHAEKSVGKDQTRLALVSRAVPLFTYDSTRGESSGRALSPQGNPALRDDWLSQPDGSDFDFPAFARTPGRVAPHFAKGDVSPEIQATNEDRLANWRQLHEMAGIERRGAQAAGKETE